MLNMSYPLHKTYKYSIRKSYLKVTKMAAKMYEVNAFTTSFSFSWGYVLLLLLLLVLVLVLRVLVLVLVPA